MKLVNNPVKRIQDYEPRLTAVHFFIA